ANTGQIGDLQEQHRVISSNLALVQVQATVVGLLAAVATLLLGAASREELDLAKVELLCASSMLTAFLSAFALGVLMPLVCIGLLALTPLWLLVAKQSPPVVKILKFGWVPIVLAMVVSSFGGLILSKTISKQQYKGMAIFAPIICVLRQVTILLYLAEVMVRLAWHHSLDPDNHCIPYLTGLGDLLGTGLLALCFLADRLLWSTFELDRVPEPAPGPP
ncbi:PREDICTED: solute carrier family 41 member 3-like, partial [Propithecus coquereli]|uniref:solute carrier family 41 member 3-like n=1 Tax=Propithecus coquereli TaxID=379532 RepID=UPI00063F3A94